MDNTKAKAPLMYGIVGPDGTAYIDENCVASSPDQLFAELNGLNDSPDAGYKIVALGQVYIDAAAPQVVADERKPFAFVIVDEDRNPEFVTPDWNSAQEHINDACEMGIENAGKWKAIPAFEMRPTDDKLWDETMGDRDQYHEWADKLSEAIALHFGGDIGEHSNMNCPWAEALEIIEQAAPVQAQEPVAVVYPPDGTVSPFTVINLGRGLVKMGDSLHDDRLPALWFGKDGLGMGVAEEMSRAAKEGETLAVVTFSNVEGLDVLAEVVQRIRSVAFPTAPVQPVAVPDGLRKAFVTLESCDARYSIVMKFNQKTDAFAAHDFLLGVGGKDYNSAAPAAQGDAKELTDADYKEGEPGWRPAFCNRSGDGPCCDNGYCAADKERAAIAAKAVTP